MIKKRMKKKRYLGTLKGLCVEHKENNSFGDQMIANTVFLIEKDKEEEFDKVMDGLIVKYNGKMKFKYIGPVPPCNFVEIVVKW